MEGFKLCVTTKLGINHAYTLELSAKTLIHHQLHGDHERTAGSAAGHHNPRREEGEIVVLNVEKCCYQWWEFREIV